MNLLKNKKRCRFFSLAFFSLYVLVFFLLPSHSLRADEKKPPVIDKDYLEYSATSAYLKAETAFLEEDTQSALEYLRTAQIFSGNSFHLLERKADFYKKEGLLTEALHHYRKSIEKYGEQPRIQKKIMEAYVLNELNDLALKENEKLLQKEPDSFLLWFQKSLILMGEKKWDKSLKVFQHLLSQELSLEKASQVLAFQSYVFTQLDKKLSALKSYQSLLALDFPEEVIALRIADLYRKMGKEGWAMDYVSQFQTKKVITKYNSYFLFDVAFSAGDWVQAFQQTENLEALGNLKKHHRFYKALYLSESQKYDRAIPYLKDLLSEDPKKGQYQYMLAANYAKSHQMEQALITYKKISETSPFFLVSRLDLAQLLEQQGEHEKSLSLLKSLAFGKTVRPLVVSEYAKSLWKLGERKQALFVLTTALEKFPFHLELLSLKASYSKKLGSTDSKKMDLAESLL